jgi:TIR domain
VALPIQKRPNDLFVSYSHVDQALVNPLVDWLQRSAGLRVWYDARSGDASKRTTQLLADAIQSARGSLFALSSNWEASTWCKDEHEFALTERREQDAYSVLAIQLNDMKFPAWFRIANVIDCRRFDAESASDLLRSMQPDAPVRYDNAQDVYFAGPWSSPSDAVQPTLGCLQEMGWRLVGDSPNDPSFRDAAERIRSIVSTARGLIGLLTFDAGRPPSNTSPWIIQEIQIARELGKPYLLLAEDKVQLPEELVTAAFTGAAIRITCDAIATALRQVLSDFDEELGRRPHTDSRSYSFLATSLLDEEPEIDRLASVLERASNMTCVRGLGLSGQHVQEEIIDPIRNAGFVIADVSDDHRNSLIEAGVALGAGTPLHLLCRLPSDGSFKRRFMFEDREMNWYQSSLERLGSVYRIGKMYRRRVFAKQP